MALTFDATYYLTARPDVFQAFVAAGGSNWPQYAEQHFNTYGWAEFTNPNATFNTRDYLTANPDVAAAGVNPFQHYLAHGVNEGRAPNATFPDRASFDSAAYLAANADLAAAGITTPEAAYAHFVIYGQFEGRPGTPSSNLTTTLTTDANVATANVFEAPIQTVSGIPAAETLNTTDVLTGTGTNPTLNAVLSGSQGPVAATLKGIETLNLTSIPVPVVGGVGSTLDLRNATGVKTINNEFSSAALTVRNATLVEGFKIGVSDSQTTTAVSFTEASTAGAEDAVTLALSNASGVTLSAQGAGKIETLNIQSSGSIGNTVASSTTVGTNLVNVTGASKLTLTTAAAKVDASTFEAALSVTAAAATVEVVGGKANDIVTISGKGAATVAAGAGDDTVIIRNLLDKSDSLDGGEGTDTVVVTKVFGGNALDVKNFETLQLGVVSSGTAPAVDADKAAGGAYDLSKLSGSTITRVAIQSTDGAAFTIDKLASGGTVALNGYNEAAAGDVLAAITVNVTDATKAANTSDVLNVEIGQLGDLDAGETFTVADLIVAGVETINLKSFGAADGGNTLTALNADAVKNVVITGDQDLTITGAFGGTTIETVNASGFSGDLTITVGNGVSATSGVTITGGSGKNTITAGGNNDTITAGGKGDVIDAGAGADTINGGAGNDRIIGGDGIDSINISSGGTDTIVLSNVLATANRDIVTGFSVGKNGDLVEVLAADTTAGTAAGSAITIQDVNVAANIAWGTAANDLLEIAIDFSGGNLLSGTGLLTALGHTITVGTAGDKGYIVAYGQGNAYLYHADSSAVTANTTVDADEIQLVGVFNGVAVGGFTADNFVLA